MNAANPTRRADFWSSTEYTTFLPALAEALSEHGWAATPRFEIAEQDYREARGRSARLALRWRAYARYPLRLRRELRRGQGPDVAVVCTNTFYAPRVAQRAARGRPVVHWVFDLFPDVLTVAGKTSADGWTARRIERLMRRTFDAAAVNVFLGEQLRAHAERRFGAIPRAVVIPVGTDVRPFAGGVVPLDEAAAPEILYCGNLGRMHDVDTVAESFAPTGGSASRPSVLRWSFRGNGAGFRDLAERLGARTGVLFGGSLRSEEWVTAMRAAAVALVTLRPGAEGVVMPSKTYSAMAAGQAILAIAPENSDLARTVRQHGCGWIVAPGDVASLRRTLDEIASHRIGLAAKRTAAWQAARDSYGAAPLAQAWAGVLDAALQWKPGAHA